MEMWQFPHAHLGNWIISMLEIASHGNMKISQNWKFGNFHVMNMMEIWSFPVWKLDNIHWLNKRDRGPQLKLPRVGWLGQGVSYPKLVGWGRGWVSYPELFRMSTGCQKTLCQYVNMSACQYVSMSICQNATFQLRYQNESCSECHQDVKQSLYHYDNMSICPYVNMSICQNATFQLRYQNESCSECHDIYIWSAYNQHK